MVEENTTTKQDEEPRGGTARLGDVRFAVKPKVVITESGPTIKFELVLKGRASIDVGVGFRLSWKGQLLDFEGPTVGLKAGDSPFKVSLRLPLDSGVRRGAKVKVTVVGPDGASLAVSSTGLVSVSTPGGATFAMGTTGVVASAAILGGTVIGVATWPWGGDDPDDPPVVVAEETVPATVPEPTAGPEVTEPPAARWPVVVPSEVVAAVDAEPTDDNPGVALFAFGRPDPLAVSFEERPGASDASTVFDVAATYQGRTHPIGTVELPSAVDPASDEFRSLRASVSSQDVPLIDAGTGSSRVCPAQGTNTVIGGYRTTSGSGDIDLEISLVPFVGDEVLSVGVQVIYVTPTELELFDPAAALPGNCDLTVPNDGFAWLGVAPIAAAGGESPEETTDESAGQTTEEESVAEDTAGDGEETGGETVEIDYADEPESGSLSLGDVGERVAALQGALASAGLYGGEIDGRFGPDTEAAVRELQSAEGLDDDGLAGPATHAALGLSYPGEDEVGGVVYGPEPSSGALQLGHEGDRVTALQVAMSERGFFTGDIDGSFGPVTEAAVREVQDAFDLEIDGIAGPATHEALNLQYP